MDQLKTCEVGSMGFTERSIFKTTLHQTLINIAIVPQVRTARNRILQTIILQKQRGRIWFCYKCILGNTLKSWQVTDTLTCHFLVSFDPLNHTIPAGIMPDITQSLEERGIAMRMDSYWAVKNTQWAAHLVAFKTSNHWSYNNCLTTTKIH
jgi:hypothetical protein